MKEGIFSWIKDGTVEGLPFTLNEPGTYPPFSDVNANCILSVPTYKFLGNSQIYGLSAPIIVGPFIYTSSIIIFEHAIEQEGDDLYLAVVKHEFGHFLGLGHDNGHIGIMRSAVSTSNKQITKWDREALAVLYSGIGRGL